MHLFVQLMTNQGTFENILDLSFQSNACLNVSLDSAIFNFYTASQKRTANSNESNFSKLITFAKVQPLVFLYFRA